ncbi:MAG: ATP-binding cassette domain-containing protein [Pseudomonadota bacterium]
MLTATSLNKSFGNLRAVSDLSLAVHSGEIVALLGPNGAGKTTTLRMLIGLAARDSGSIEYVDGGGRSHDGLPPAEIGYLPEERGLYIDRRVIDGLVYFARLRGRSKSEALESAQHWLERFDLWDRRADEVKTLSKGNQQKVQFISAVIHRPRLAIIDEPFSGFDPINQERMLEFLEELRKAGTAILFSAHQMDLVQRLADRILLLSRGQLVAEGSLSEIREHAGRGNAQTVEVEFDSPPEAEQLKQAPSSCRLEGNTIELTVTDSQTINDALRWLTSLGTITAMTTREPSLHDIYLDQLKESTT